MADLPILADRLNDIEISSGAPITEALKRKVGSNINYLLDFLGITDGSTSVAGTLSEFSQALETISNSSMTNIASIGTSAGPGTLALGSFDSNRFIRKNYYFAMVANAASGNMTFTPTFSVSFDGGGSITIPSQHADKALGTYKQQFDTPTSTAASSGNLFSFSNFGGSQSAGPVTIAGNGQNAIFLGCMLDPRDYNTSANLSVTHTGTAGNTAIEFYEELTLNLHSTGF